MKLSPHHQPSDNDSHYDDEPPHDTDQYTLTSTNQILESIDMESTEPSTAVASDGLLIPLQLQSSLAEEETANNTKLPILRETQNDQSHDEFGKFGDFVAEVMRNMTKSQSRAFQMKIMGLIVESEENN